MAIKLADAIVYFKGDQSHLNKAMDQSETNTKSWASRVGSIIGTGIKAGTVVAGGAILGIGTAAAKMAVDSAPIQGVSAAFEGITGNADEALSTLRAGSLGMVRDADLMTTYNKATQLVSKQFADELPGAMQYLSKVSAATGQDMGYLLDSLTTGVGRLSPMILDNLAIQVDLTAANEDYAASIGKSADELTKQEQQAALMAQVMDKLAENTASMPDITDNAATSMAQLNVMVQNLKDSVGVALLPALSALLKPLVELAQKYGPELTAWAEKAGEWLGEKLPLALSQLSSDMGPVGENLASLRESLSSLWEKHGDKILVVLGLIIAGVEGAVVLISGSLSTLFALLDGDTEAWKEAYLGTIEGFLDIATGLVGSSGEEFLATWKNNFEMIPKIIQQLIDAAWQKLEDFKQMVKDAVSNAIESITGFNPGELIGLGGRYGSQNNVQNVTMYGATFNGVSDAGGLMTQLSTLGG